jgi:hypothetical protein
MFATKPNVFESLTEVCSATYVKSNSYKITAEIEVGEGGAPSLFCDRQLDMRIGIYPLLS